ncbi:MAG: phosphoadenylyl-sulfate reductase [Alphaproteobacteria bacterium]|nr:phosphoadenylyl-sulfate reductase [Alphaproteobacteria bacterium]
MSPAPAPLRRAHLDQPRDILWWALDAWGPELAFTTGLGAGGICLLHLARQHPSIQRRGDLVCVFLDTGFHFAETLQYARDVADFLDVDIVSVRPEPYGPTWREDRLACCDHRKVKPLAVALEGKRAWVNARRGDQGGLRAGLSFVQRDEDGFIKINPLARVSRAWVNDYMVRHGIPTNPLLDQGYGSVGCEPCTRKLKPGESERAGRLFAGGKTECGIHTRLKVKR